MPRRKAMEQPTLDEMFGWTTATASANDDENNSNRRDNNDRGRGSRRGKRRKNTADSKSSSSSSFKPRFTSHEDYLMLPHYSMSKIPWKSEILPTLQNIKIDSVDQLIAI